METYIKYFIAITGLVTVILKLIESLNSNQRKKELVTDLELLNKISSLDLSIEEKKSLQLHKSKIIKEIIEYQSTIINWFDLFYALIIFVGFGWWTLEIYRANSNFNPWIIATTILSFVGLALIIDTKWMKKKETTDDNVLLKITVFKDIKLAAIIIGTTLTIGLMLYFKLFTYTHVLIFPAAFFLMGLKMLSDSIRFRKR